MLGLKKRFTFQKPAFSNELIVLWGAKNLKKLFLFLCFVKVYLSHRSQPGIEPAIDYMHSFVSGRLSPLGNTGETIESVSIL